MRIRMINSCLISSEIDVWHRMLMALSNQLIVNHTAGSNACIIIIIIICRKSNVGTEKIFRMRANVKRICMKIMANYCGRITVPIHSGVLSNFVGCQWNEKIAQTRHGTHTQTHMWRLARLGRRYERSHRFEWRWMLRQYIYHEFMIINQNGMKCCMLRYASSTDS